MDLGGSALIFFATFLVAHRMGACCSREPYGNGVDVEDAVADREQEDGEEGDAIIGDYGARVRLYGASKYTSMYTQQGRKVTNQDAMTVWEVIKK